MKTIIDTTADLDVPAALDWAVWSDVDRWSEWDPHEERANLVTEFVTGGTGYAKPKGAPGGTFTLLEVVPGTRWVSTSGLPFGRLTGDHTIEPIDDQRCRVRIHTTATGLGAWIVDIGWGRRMRRDADLTLAALGERARPTR